MNPQNQSKKTFLKNKKFLIPAIAAIVVAAGIFIFSAQGENRQIVRVEKRTVVQEVAVTGKTKPALNVELAFEKGGRITRVFAELGSKVKAGERIASIDSSELEAQAREAEASLAAQKARLAELKIGARPEEIKISEVKVENALSALGDGRQNLIDKIEDSLTKADDAVKNKTDQLFSNAGTPQNNLLVYGGILKNSAESKRFELEIMFRAWKVSLSKISSAADLDNYASESRENLSAVKSFLDIMAEIVNQLTSNASPADNRNADYKSDISSARINVNSAVNNLSSAEEKLKNAGSGLALAKEELRLKRAGATKEQIATSEAQVKEAESRLNLIQAQIAKSTLRAPLKGLVTRQDAKIGELAKAGEELVSIISDDNLIIEANVPEIDIGEIAPENPVKITFDALPKEEFSGKIFHIDPAETLIDGVVNFKIKVALDKNDSRLKSGLTSNLKIQTLTKSGVLTLPRSAVSLKDGSAFVKKIISGEIKEIPVKLGVMGSANLVEIISGLNEGDEIATGGN